MESTVAQTIAIERCPECEKPHRLALRIRRTSAVLLVGDAVEDRPSTFTCLFNCPNTGRAFEIDLSFAPTSTHRTLSVEGSGIVAEEVT